MQVNLVVDPALDPCPVQPVVVWGEGINSAVVADALRELLVQTVQQAREHGIAEERRQQVRQMLRHGKFRATGRAKPASEFLLQTAQSPAGLPSILAPVDINNIVSLESGFPASIFDAELMGCDLLLRWGAPGESYVFNSAGHSIDLQDLLVVCGGAHLEAAAGQMLPCGNPIKDAMRTKIRPESQRVIGVVYAPAGTPGA